MKIFVDYAHTPDAIENVILTATELKWAWKIITIFWATWDRDKTKRPIMWKIVSNISDVVILTQDDDYSEDTNEIIKDVLTWIERKQWEDFWIVPDRKSAIRTALLKANSKDIVLVLWKWDEHIMMTNNWPIEWHDKTVIKELLKEIKGVSTK
jgi:UDP-N-acetylmuramoyl-L-alanyl-D-glutamate--2,6-diaminopimelate ligase